MRRWTVFCCFALLVTLAASAQNFAPPEPLKPTDEQLQSIKTRTNKLEFASCRL